MNEARQKRIEAYAAARKKIKDLNYRLKMVDEILAWRGDNPISSSTIWDYTWAKTMDKNRVGILDAIF